MFFIILNSWFQYFSVDLLSKVYLLKVIVLASIVFKV